METRIPTPQEIEDRAYDVRLSLTGLCRAAEISPHVMIGWKAGRSSPTLANLQRVLDTLDRLERDRKRKRA